MESTAVCPNGHENPPTARFCRHCGAPVPELPPMTDTIPAAPPAAAPPAAAPPVPGVAPAPTGRSESEAAESTVVCPNGHENL
ncbi:MAG: zinc-ribbon domain-containing protein, partial [Acidimicrobiales bacterium]